MGREPLNTGSEVLIDSLKGNDIESKLDQRIHTAEKRIIDSIEDGINNMKRAKRKISLKRRKICTLHDHADISKKKQAYKQKRLNITLLNISNRRNYKIYIELCLTD